MLFILDKTVIKFSSLREILLIAALFASEISAVDSAKEGAGFAQDALRQAEVVIANESSTENNESQQSSDTDIEFAKRVNRSAEAREAGKTIVSSFKPAKELEFVTGKLPATGEGESCEDCGSVIVDSPTEKDFLVQRPEDDSDTTRSDEAGTPQGNRVQGSSLLVFVSFSLPNAALVELSDQSQKYGATLVLRGLHEDSFLKTKDKIMEINPNGLRLDIDPELFKQYGIKRVPTFVLVENGQEVSRLSGNVTLEFASSKLRREQVLAGQAINGVVQ